ncbi:hypothetical protein COCON_G00018650 [Conger conger]|uniref:Uncharacterized protein n=1 Tax=Conger conger TaxID=82655 RepID=A0A9Q1E3Y1_CONCO|nr:hypothetical protein COCON_G00018650 [Conger conger]
MQPTVLDRTGPQKALNGDQPNSVLGALNLTAHLSRHTPAGALCSIADHRTGRVARTGGYPHAFVIGSPAGSVTRVRVRDS